MSAITVELPVELEGRLESIAAEFGVSVSDLLVDAAQKMSQADSLEELKRKAQARDTKAGFERVLSAVPDSPPTESGDVIQQ
ncbi:MAG: hypothetical protein ACRD6X_22445 [Pyrinomonadaceae bacterium]